jgi:hypothetical protein
LTLPVDDLPIGVRWVTAPSAGTGLRRTARRNRRNGAVDAQALIGEVHDASVAGRDRIQADVRLVSHLQLSNRASLESINWMPIKFIAYSWG